MLTSFTWHQFFLYLGSALLLYYLVTLFFCYRQELFHLYRKYSRRAPPSAASPPEPDACIGPVAAEISLTDAAAIRVASPPEAADNPGTASDTDPEPLPAALAALLEAVEPLLDHAARTGAEKNDFLSLLRLLMADFPLADDRHREMAIRSLLAAGNGRLSFQLTAAELQQLWPEQEHIA